MDGAAPGLVDALFEGEDPLELLQSPFPDLPRLQVLAAGRIPPDASNRLRPYELTRAFEALSAHATLVVIDTAPLLPVVDTRILLDQLALDAQLIVARMGVTKREDIRHARSLLEDRGLSRSVGLVVNALPARLRNYYYGEDPTAAQAAGKGKRTAPSHAAG